MSSDDESSQAADAELVAARREGRFQAWEALVKRFERLTFTVPRRAGLTSEDAADVFQTVFLRLHQPLHTLDQREPVRAWLVTTARRETRWLVALEAKRCDAHCALSEGARASHPRSNRRSSRAALSASRA